MSQMELDNDARNMTSRLASGSQTPYSPNTPYGEKLEVNEPINIAKIVETEPPFTVKLCIKCNRSVKLRKKTPSKKKLETLEEPSIREEDTSLD